MLRVWGIVLWLGICAPATAAEITVLPGKGEDATIIIEGPLYLRDGANFRTKISQYSKGLVVLRSEGGSVFAGIEIGRLIRLRNFSTWVPSGLECASACAIAWLGGSPRAMGKNAKVGFHAAYHIEDDGRPSESGMANALVGSYYQQLGLPDRAIMYLTYTSPRSMSWLTPADANKLGIDVTVFDFAEANSPPKIEPASSALEARAASFLKENYQNVSGAEASMLAWAYKHYSDPTVHFGKSKSRADVLAEISRGFERWPRRQYNPRPQSVSIKCDQAASTCTAEGMLDFVTESQQRNERSSGVASFSFTLLFSETDAKIVTEGGKTLQLHKEAIVSDTIGRGGNSFLLR